MPLHYDTMNTLQWLADSRNKISYYSLNATRIGHFNIVLESESHYVILCVFTYVYVNAYYYHFSDLA